jgi:hypothetical protein
MRSGKSLTGTARLAAIVAPWIVVPIVALALKGGPHLSRLDLFASGLLAGFLFGLPLTYLAVLLIGYPAYKLLLAYERLNAWSLCGVGAIAGALGGLIFIGTGAVLLCSFSGLAVAFVTWLMIRHELVRNWTEQANSLRAPDKSLERTRGK